MFRNMRIFFLIGPVDHLLSIHNAVWATYRIFSFPVAIYKKVKNR